MSKRTPVHAIIHCIISTEMLVIAQEMTSGASEITRKMWDDAEKVRNFIDQPRLADHRTFLVAQLRRMKAEQPDHGLNS